MNPPEGDNLAASSPDQVYRAISSTSHANKRQWPLLVPPVRPQRWNKEDQPTIYASHEPEVAAAEKLAHLASSITLRTARSFWSTAPTTDEVLVLSFKPGVFRARLVDLSRMPNIADYLTPDYDASQELAAVLMANGPITALKSPSAEFWPAVRLNEAYFVTLAGQPQPADFPPVAEHGWFKGSLDSGT